MARYIARAVVNDIGQAWRDNLSFLAAKNYLLLIISDDMDAADFDGRLELGDALEDLINDLETWQGFHDAHALVTNRHRYEILYEKSTNGKD